MQLPPTILSVDDHRKPEKKAQLSSKTKVQSGRKQGPATKAPEPAQPDVVEDKDVASEVHSSSDAEVNDEDEEIQETTEISKKSNLPMKAKPTRTKKPRGLRPPRSLETTLFDRLEKMYGPSIKRMLNVQYRCVDSSCRRAAD